MIKGTGENEYAYEGFCCDCCGGHSLQVTYHPTDKSGPEQLYVTVMMDLKAWPFWKRVGLAWRFIRGYTSTVEEVILGGKDIERFLDYEADVWRVKKAAEANMPLPDIQKPVMPPNQMIKEGQVERPGEVGNKNVPSVAFLSIRVGATEKRIDGLEREVASLTKGLTTLVKNKNK